MTDNDTTDSTDESIDEVTDDGLTRSRRLRPVGTTAKATGAILALFAGTLAAGVFGYLNDTLLTMVITTLLILVGAGAHWLYGGEAVEAGREIAGDVSEDEQ